MNISTVATFAVIRASGAAFAFPFLLSALLMRILAAAVSLGKPNDEMRLSLWLGLGEWTVFAGVIGFLLALALLASRRLGLTWRAIAAGAGLWLATSALILSEPFLPTYR